MIDHPSKKLPPAKRARLFEVASTEFAAHGFAQASLNRIIAEVSMSKSSFYHYFLNKTDLFDQTLEQSLAPFNEMQKSFDLDLLTAETFWPMVQMMTREMMHMANRSPELVKVGQMFYRSRENPEEQKLTHDLMAKTTAWLEGLLGRGQGLGLLRRDLPDSFIIDILMALGMAMDQWVLAHWDEFSDEKRIALSDKSFDLFARILAPDSGLDQL